VTRKRSSRRRWILLGAAAVLAVAGLVVLWKLVPVRDLLERLRSFGPWGPVALVGIYVVGAVVLLPGTIPTLAAGALFGMGVGTAVVVVGANLGALAAFLVARALGRKRLEKRIRGSERLDALDEAIRDEGLKVVFLTRLSPGFPYNALNYLLGLTRVRPRDYVLGTLGGTLPGILAYVYVGTLAGLAASGDRERTPLEWTLLGIGLAATAVLVVFLTRLGRRALDRRLRGTGRS
jgi:uncharacterized membrane protein YdjX (TVP38/TMEM64 family)